MSEEPTAVGAQPYTELDAQMEALLCKGLALPPSTVSTWAESQTHSVYSIRLWGSW